MYRITGTKDHILNFKIPKELVENRVKTWDTLFNKYSEEVYVISIHTFISIMFDNLY